MDEFIHHETLKFQNVEFAIHHLIEDCPAHTVVRELIKNAEENATLLSPAGKMECFQEKVLGVRKLGFFNEGPGMSAEDLRRLMDMASTGKTLGTSDNFGQGGKVSGLKVSPRGLVYRSCKDGRVCQITLAAESRPGVNYPIYVKKRDFSTIAGDFRMTELGPSRKLRGKSLLLRRATPCSALQSTRRTPPWASPIPRCSRTRRSSRAVGITRIGRVRSAASLALGIGSGPAPCMISAIRWGGGPVTFTSPIRNTTASGASTTSPPTYPAWPHPRPATPIGSWPWPSGWSSRTAYPIRPPVGTSGATTASSSPSPPSRTGSRPGGKKAADRIGTDYLDWALDGFSGYIAADELYDGPFCVLSIVDNRAFRRLCYEVLDHAPTHRDIRRFFRRFRAALTGRGLTLRGVTTDGSDLYPRPISEVFGAVEHQVCRFHILAELNKAVLRAIARVRKHLAAQQPELPRGRPGTPEARRKARRRRHLQRKVGDLFEHRHLFVKRHLAEGERQILRRITRGLPQLGALRRVVEEIHRLFDRRCRTETALRKLARLRAQVHHFKGMRPIFQKLESPDLEKALTFLDDSLLGSTSNAVERGNRRHRKMQKTVYRVRTQATIRGRIALDMFREIQGPPRAETMKVLHRARLR